MLKRRLFTLMCSGLLTSLALAGNGGKPDDEAVTISGIVFQFNTSMLLAGARVSLAEFPLEQYPEMYAMSQADGTFALHNVPSGIKVTPRVELAGFQPMWHQTFETKKGA